MRSRFRISPAFFAVLLAGITVLPLSLDAQGSARTNDGLAPGVTSSVASPGQGATNGVAPAAGPRAVPAGITMAASDIPLSPAPNDNIGAGSNVAMMGVGAAGVVVGLLIGGDGGTLVALGGGVIGLIGLFRYLR